MKKERETFKPVYGFEEKYLATNLGRVWSIKNKMFLKPHTDSKGYQYIQLCITSRKYKAYKLHRIIYEAFRGALPKGWDVDHLDQNKFNNNIKNLVGMEHGEHVRKHRLGKKMSEEVKRKISISRKKAWNKLKGIKDQPEVVKVNEKNYIHKRKR